MIPHTRAHLVDGVERVQLPLDVCTAHSAGSQLLLCNCCPLLTHVWTCWCTTIIPNIQHSLYARCETSPAPIAHLSSTLCPRCLLHDLLQPLHMRLGLRPLMLCTLHLLLQAVVLC